MRRSMSRLSRSVHLQLKRHCGLSGGYLKLKNTDMSQSLLGRFWLPSRGEDTAVSGVLDFDDAGATVRRCDGATVRLEGALTPAGLLANAIVLAKLQGRHEKATLFNCFASARKKGDGTVVSSTIKSTRIAFGSLRKDLGGRGVQFRLPGSPTWFHEQCFDADIGDHSAAVVRFKAFEATRYPLPDGLILKSSIRPRCRLAIGARSNSTWTVRWVFESSRPSGWISTGYGQ